MPFGALSITGSLIENKKAGSFEIKGPAFLF